MDTLILLLFISSLASHQVLGQDVDTRGTNDKVSGEGGGQPRTIYSQRHLSPHRMMHFGKRPSNPLPPTIMTPRVYDLYRPDGQQLHLQPDRYPYLLSIELERGQTLQAVPEELSSFSEFQPDRNLMYSLERPQQIGGFNSAEQQQMLQQMAARPLSGQKLLKLISDSNNNNDGDSNGKNDNDELANVERAQPSSNSQDDIQQQQQAISVNTRSMQTSRANTISLPKAYISSLLYGRQGSSSMPNFGSYNKKAEPKDNFFMHFGRK